MTIWRVVGGFTWLPLVAVPLGIVMGAYKPIEAFFEPFVSFARYLPASAFIPLLILWAGLGERRSCWSSSSARYFSSCLMVAITVADARRDLVEAAYDAGCARLRHRRTRAAARRRAGDRRDPAHSCSAGPGPTSSSPS